MYSKKIFIAVSTAAVIGVLGLGSATRANDIDESASGAEAAKMHGNPLPWWWNQSEEGRGSFAYQPFEPSQAKPQRSPKHHATKH
jgi:hypothetical protein